MYLKSVFCVSFIVTIFGVGSDELRKTRETRSASAQAAARVTYSQFGNIESYAGHLVTNATTQSKLFYWFFPAKVNKNTAPIILCLQGGPGNSSLHLLFFENGPFKIVDANTVSLRNNSWIEHSSVLYIDSPFGTGFSVTNGGSPTSIMQICQYLRDGIQQFFTIFPEYASRDFHVMGQEYAGLYVTSLAPFLYSVGVRLRGVIVANGLIDPVRQLVYAENLYNLVVIDNVVKGEVTTLQNNLVSYLNAQNWSAAIEGYKLIFEKIKTNAGFETLNNFQYTRNPISALNGHLVQFLNKIEVKNALHVGATTFRMTAATNTIYTDHYSSVSDKMGEMLESTKFLLYHGNLDLAIPYASLAAYVYDLPYVDIQAYRNFERQKLFIGDDFAAYIKHGGNLYEALVRNAGRHAAMDQPECVSELVKRFVNNQVLWTILPPEPETTQD